VPGIALVGLVLIGLAVASATVWKPPETVTASHSAGSGASLLWTDPGVLEAWNDQVSIDVTTKTAPGVVVAIGRSNDVAKWVADSPFERITGLGSRDTFTVTNGGSTEQIVAAQDSDLWVASREVTSSQTISWSHKPGRWSLLIAPMEGADGEFGTMAGTTVSLTWTRAVETPYLSRGITLGIVLIAISSVVLIWDIRHRRRLDLVTERLAAREAGLQREAGPQISRRSHTPEETSVMKAVATELPDLEAGGQVAPASQPKPRRARLRHADAPSPEEPTDVAAPAAATDEPAEPAASQAKARRGRLRHADAPSPEEPTDVAAPAAATDEAAEPAVTKAEPAPSQPKARRGRLRHADAPSSEEPTEAAAPAAATDEPAEPPAPKVVSAPAKAAAQTAAAQPAPERAEPKGPAKEPPPDPTAAPAKAPVPKTPVAATAPVAPAPGKPVTTDAAEPALTEPDKPRRWFSGRKKPAAAEPPTDQADQAEPAEALALNLGLATPQRRWEKLKQTDQATADQPEAALPVFGAKVDPVLGPIAAPASPPPVATWGQGNGEAAGTAAEIATTNQKIEALKAAHSSKASQAAATIAAAVAAAQGTGSAAGLTRRQIREAERAAHDALRTHPQTDLPLPPRVERPVKMQGEDSE